MPSTKNRRIDWV